MYLITVSFCICILFRENVEVFVCLFYPLSFFHVSNTPYSWKWSTELLGAVLYIRAIFSNNSFLSFPVSFLSFPAYFLPQTITDIALLSDAPWDTGAERPLIRTCSPTCDTVQFVPFSKMPHVTHPHADRPLQNNESPFLQLSSRERAVCQRHTQTAVRARLGGKGNAKGKGSEQEESLLLPGLHILQPRGKPYQNRHTLRYRASLISTVSPSLPHPHHFTELSRDSVVLFTI